MSDGSARIDDQSSIADSEPLQIVDAAPKGLENLNEHVNEISADVNELQSHNDEPTELECYLEPEASEYEIQSRHEEVVGLRCLPGEGKAEGSAYEFQIRHEEPVVLQSRFEKDNAVYEAQSFHDEPVMLQSHSEKGAGNAKQQIKFLLVCGGNATLVSCTNCCSLEQGCVYLDRATGSPTSVGGRPRPCTRECSPQRSLKVCPLSHSSVTTTTITKVPSPLPSGCRAFKVHTAKKASPKCLTNAIKVCNGQVSFSDCGSCCRLPKGCLALGAGRSNICLPSALPVLCTLNCSKTVSVCSNSTAFQGASLDLDSCLKCRQKLEKDCKIYNATTGAQLCA